MRAEVAEVNEKKLSLRTAAIKYEIKKDSIHRRVQALLKGDTNNIFSNI